MASALIFGALGGTAFALFGLMLSLRALARTQDKRVRQLLTAGLLNIALSATLGAIVGAILDGKAGSFLDGLTAVGLVSALVQSDVTDESAEEAG